ncbi:MAG TPA: hypothetical protein PKY59_21640 [Pyrinomonadaceae bacterium]|nr:hypothetical protein [Pyrinomonadaceae bacterium]
MSQENIPVFAIIISFVSLIISLSSFLVSFLNYRRDKYTLIVDLYWDSGKYYVGMQSNVKETWGTITVSNRGRRPIYIRNIGLKYPDDERVFNLLDEDKIEGVKLGEHDAPIIIKVSQDDRLKKYAKEWNKIYAVALDISGKEYKSSRLCNKPSWAE